MPATSTNASRGFINRILGFIEFAGNKLPDPAVLFLLLLFVTWGVSYVMAPIEFSEINPKTSLPIRIVNQLSGTALAARVLGGHDPELGAVGER